MKKLFLVALLCVGITTFAQPKRERKPEKEKLSTEAKVEKQVDKLRADLSLNDKQVAEVKTLVTEQVTKREAKRAEMQANKTAEKSEMKAKMMQEQNAMKEKMKKILTADQFTKWEANKEQMKEKMISKMKYRKQKRELPKDKL